MALSCSTEMRLRTRKTIPSLVFNSEVKSLPLVIKDSRNSRTRALSEIKADLFEPDLPGNRRNNEV